MSLTFVTVNALTNSVLFCGNNVHFPYDHNSFTTILDDTDNGVKDLIANVNSHKFNDIMVGKPYITATYDGSNIVANLINPPASVPTQSTISILGTSYTCSIANNQIIFPIDFHPSVAQNRVNAVVKVDGLPYVYLEIGGNFGNTEIQVYTDSNGGHHVVPLKSSDLAAYWQNSKVDMTWSQADLATITGLLTEILIQHVIPALNLTLTEDEKNGITDMQATILPSIVSNLATIAPLNGVKDIHYLSYKSHLIEAKTAMDSYKIDRDEIMKYTTLK